MNHYFIPGDTSSHKIKYIDYEFRGQRFRFATHAGVFSKDHADSATDILLNAIPDLPKGSALLDLGCGYGIIGIVLSKTYCLEVTFADVNPAAVELTRRNCELNGVKAQVFESDCFDRLSAVNRQSTIVINPPIHAGKSVTYKMYEASRGFLLPGGKLYVVTLKKHGAESTIKKLKEIYESCEIIYKKKGVFVIASTS
jgi:16S rRNA (guanine1207-N2)-methyltransferase